jgi:hypothetical protein
MKKINLCVLSLIFLTMTNSAFARRSASGCSISHESSSNTYRCACGDSNFELQANSNNAGSVPRFVNACQRGDKWTLGNIK